MTPEDYQLTQTGQSYLLFIRESTTSKEKYLLTAHHFGKYAYDDKIAMFIAQSLTRETATKYKEIEKAAKALCN